MNKKFETMVSEKEIMDARNRLIEFCNDKLPELKCKNEIHTNYLYRCGDTYIVNSSDDHCNEDFSKLKALLSIKGKVVEVDILLYNLLKELNKYFFNTLYSCSGHESDLFEGFYIRFKSFTGDEFLKEICDELGFVFDRQLLITTEENDIYKEGVISLLNPTEEDIIIAKKLLLKNSDSLFNANSSGVSYNEFIDIRMYKNNERTDREVDYDYIYNNKLITIVMINKFIEKFRYKLGL